MAKIKKEKTLNRVKDQTKSAGVEIQKTAELTKDTFGSLFNMICEIPKLPWKKLPLKGYLCLGVVFLVAILLIVATIIGG